MMINAPAGSSQAPGALITSPEIWTWKLPSLLMILENTGTYLVLHITINAVYAYLDSLKYYCVPFCRLSSSKTHLIAYSTIVWLVVFSAGIAFYPAGLSPCPMGCEYY